MHLAATAATLAAFGAIALAPGTAAAATPAGTCNLGPGGAIKHVVVMQFDNTHLARDAAGVQSDLEQMPALKGYLTSNGTLLSNDHTILISHTAGGIVSTQTGLYPDNNGLTVSNSFEFFDPSKASGSDFASSFQYWTDLVKQPNDTTPLLTTLGGKNTPAPWVPFTRAGCDFAGVGAADIELENTSSDVKKVFGAGSPEAAISTANGLAQADLVGYAIHCSQQSSAPGGRCADGKADSLTDEPNSDGSPGNGTGYSGFKGLFGALAVNPALTGMPASGTTPPNVFDVFAPNATNTGPDAATVHDAPANVTPPPDTTAGATTTAIEDKNGNSGFPGFDGAEANEALGYTAAAQEAGVPVTYTYLSDVHDDHYKRNHGNAFGPGEAGDVQQLKEYDAAFAAFFARLAKHGITKSNTLFAVTVDEGDHYAGGQALNPGCDGPNVPCQYQSGDYGQPGFQRNVGEVNVNLQALVKDTTGDQTVFGQNFDDAPTIFVKGQPGQEDSSVRQLEREMGDLSEYDPIDGTSHMIAVNLADQTQEKILHMVNGDPLRTPTFTMFGDADFRFVTSCQIASATGTTVTDKGPGCPAQGWGFAYNHGDNQPEIATTWQGWVGPGIKNDGTRSDIWTDHTDLRPTLLSVLGLKDDYATDGRDIAEITQHGNLQPGVAGNVAAFTVLSDVYKQLTAPFGEFAMATLDADTRALKTTSPSDGTYHAWEDQLNACLAQRDPLAAQIRTMLNAAEFNGQPLDTKAANSIRQRARRTIAAAQRLGDAETPPKRLVCDGA